MPLFGERLQETSTTGGTGAQTLAGASSKHFALSTTYADGVRFKALLENTTDAEVSICYLSGSGATLNRETCIKSTNLDAFVSFSGTVTISAGFSARDANELFAESLRIGSLGL